VDDMNSKMLVLNLAFTAEHFKENLPTSADWTPRIDRSAHLLSACVCGR